MCVCLSVHNFMCACNAVLVATERLSEPGTAATLRSSPSPPPLRSHNYLHTLPLLPPLHSPLLLQKLITRIPVLTPTPTANVSPQPSPPLRPAPGTCGVCRVAFEAHKGSFTGVEWIPISLPCPPGVLDRTRGGREGEAGEATTGRIVHPEHHTDTYTQHTLSWHTTHEWGFSPQHCYLNGIQPGLSDCFWLSNSWEHVRRVPLRSPHLQ